MKSLIKPILLIVFICCFACEDQGFIVRCPDCTAEEPIDTDLVIKVGSGFSNNHIVVDVYEGNLEDSVLYNTFIVSLSESVTKVTLNKKYTLTATYTAPDGTKYIAVDSTVPKVKYEKDQCDDPCFFVYDKKVDLRLKYSK